MTWTSKAVGRGHDSWDAHDYPSAGEWYSIAGHGRLAGCWTAAREENLSYLLKGSLLQAIVYWQYATTCYRVADEDGRAENRARQGVLALSDLRGRLAEHPAWIGLSWELEADLRIAGGVEGERSAEAAYATAPDHLREVERSDNSSESLSWNGEPRFNETALYLTEVADGADVDLTLDGLRLRDGDPSIVNRTEYERDRFRSLHDRLAGRDAWDVADPDLTTVEEEQAAEEGDGAGDEDEAGGGGGNAGEDGAGADGDGS